VAHAESPVDLRSRYGILVLMQNIDRVTLLRGMSDAKRNISSAQVTQLPLPTRAFDSLNTACESTAIRRSLRGAFINGCVQSFLASVLTALRQPAPVASLRGSPLVAEAEKLVRVDISLPDLSVASLAARLGCSPDHLARCFRHDHGITPVAWITRERIELACEILARMDRNISEVAWSCGFVTPSYFIKVFRKHKGMTPAAWRRPSTRPASPAPQWSRSSAPAAMPAAWSARARRRTWRPWGCRPLVSPSSSRAPTPGRKRLPA
jgi:AraC-like DNA-binding protein